MIKKATKKAFLQGYRKILRSARGFRFYNSVYEVNWLPTPIRNLLVLSNCHIQADELGSSQYTLSLIRNGLRVDLPPIQTLSHWQFVQSYRWATPFYAELIRRLLAHYPSGLWIDIGANQGIRCLDAHDAGWQVWAYEPNAEALSFYRELLQRNSWLNRPGDRQVQAAVGDKESELMVDIDASSYLSSVSGVDKPEGFEIARSETVQCLRMDRQFERWQAEISSAFAKVDVEGFEVAVLEGFGSSLSQLRALLVEVTRSSVVPVSSMLESAGFQLLFIDERYHKLTPGPNAVLPQHGTFDLLAWPQALPLPSIL